MMNNQSLSHSAAVHKPRISVLLGLLLAAVLTFGLPLGVYAAGPGSEGAGSNPAQPANAQQDAQAQALEIAAEGAVLYDVTHNRFLYEKNADTHFYPASTTKLMTALLVAERCSFEETVTFSETAVSRLESGAVTLKVKAGDQFSVKDCMYGLLLKSANEVANGLAEHVGGSIEGFAGLMNQRAAALGCTNTHFVNPNGLNDPQHFTSARDMALIARAAFENETVRQIASTLKYSFPASKSVPSVRELTMGHKMLDPSRAEYYPGFVAGKTGFTSLAGNTLVTCVEKDGVRLIVVILKSRQTHYADTKKLLDYGFAAAAASQGAAGPVAGNGNTAPGTTGAQQGSQSAPGATGAQQGNQGVPGTSGAQQGSQGAPGTSGAQQGNQGAPGGAYGNGQNTGTAQQGTSGTGAGPLGGQNIQEAAVGREAYPEVEGTWSETAQGWQFLKKTGGYARGETFRNNGRVYGFGTDCYMLTGWHLVNGTWHYFDANGSMAFGQWIETSGLWYYVDANGSLFVNGTTPDGYRVDANGVWIR